MGPAGNLVLTVVPTRPFLLPNKEDRGKVGSDTRVLFFVGELFPPESQ